ncbi:hypothetical protein BDV19DRAFT_360824 [Aspergillus venezuelensis]
MRRSTFWLVPGSGIIGDPVTWRYTTAYCHFRRSGDAVSRQIPSSAILLEMSFLYTSRCDYSITRNLVRRG